VGRRDVDDVDVRVFGQALVGAVVAWDLLFAGERGCGGFGAGADGEHLGLW
jgi:hypothetical protein